MVATALIAHPGTKTSFRMEKSLRSDEAPFTVHAGAIVVPGQRVVTKHVGWTRLISAAELPGFPLASNRGETRGLFYREPCIQMLWIDRETGEGMLSSFIGERIIDHEPGITVRREGSMLTFSVQDSQSALRIKRRWFGDFTLEIVRRGTKNSFSRFEGHLDGNCYRLDPAVEGVDALCCLTPTTQLPLLSHKRGQRRLTS